MKIYFTSDTHYQHTNICRGITKWTRIDGTRDLSTIEEMNSTIINTINDIVMPDDQLYHLGDWSFGGFDKIKEFRCQLNVKTIHLILGNHDRNIEINRGNSHSLFTTIQKSLDLTFQGYKFNLCHFPPETLSDGVYYLHGHTHGALPSTDKYKDVGVDTNNFKPYSLEDIFNYFNL